MLFFPPGNNPIKVAESKNDKFRFQFVDVMVNVIKLILVRQSVSNLLSFSPPNFL